MPPPITLNQSIHPTHKSLQLWIVIIIFQIETLCSSPLGKLTESDLATVIGIDELEGSLGVRHLNLPLLEGGGSSLELGQGDLVVGVAVDTVEGHPVLEVLAEVEQQVAELGLGDGVGVGFGGALHFVLGGVEGVLQGLLGLGEFGQAEDFAQAGADLDQGELTVSVLVELFPEVLAFFDLGGAGAVGNGVFQLTPDFGRDFVVDHLNTFKKMFINLGYVQI